jgi:hypothetical protein
MLVDYELKCSKVNYGMTYKQFLQLAHYCGRLQSKFPSSWIDNKIVGIDWLQGFMKRHKNLTLRKPENTNLFRTTAFNKKNVMEFFDNCERALKSWNFIVGREYNNDESGVSTVVQSHNFVVQIGKIKLDKLSMVKVELRYPYV